MVKQPNKVLVNVALTEFNALRNEIMNRSSSLFTLLNLNITVTATICGFVLSKTADSRLLLILPLLSPALGMLSLDHSFNINNIGNYIKTQIRPVILDNIEYEDLRLLNYESFVARYEQNVLLRLLPLGLPLMLLFIAIPLSASLFLTSKLQNTWEKFLLVAGLIMIVSYMVFWIKFMMQPFKQKS